MSDYKVGAKITLCPDMAKLYGHNSYVIDYVHPPAPPIVCLPLMRIPALPEKGTKYLPEMWRPDGSRNPTR